MLDTALGSTLGDYRLERVLGEGGMGRVYAGTELATGRLVAIKVIGEEHANEPELIGRFYAEAHAASRIRHPSIIEVLALVYLPDGRPAIVMELVEGPTLRALISAGTVAIDTALDVVEQVLDAITAAHAAGIVHRDLKPDNIVITPSGVAKVLDFGIAKLAAGDLGHAAPRTRTGMMLGTPDYMAPEQITGGAIDGRTDVYAMGVVLYETLTGRRPFDGDSQFMLLRAHLEMPAPYASDVRPDVPAELSRVVMRAMAKAPADRFATPEEMKAALRDPSNAWLPPATSSPSLRDPSNALAVASRSSSASYDAFTPPPQSNVLPAVAHVSIAPPAVPAPASRSSQRWLIVAGIVALFALALGIGLIVRHRRLARPTVASTPATAATTAPTKTAAPLATAPAAPAATTLPPGATSAGDDWVRYPAPANAARFDLDALRDEQLARARVLMPDAHLNYITLQSVRADGTLDLAPTSVTLMFASPSIAAKRPADLPANVDYRTKCQVVMHISTVMVQSTLSVDACKPPKAPPPRCTVKQIWERAKKKGANPTYAADISFVDGKWSFSIYNVPPKDEKSLYFDDKC